MFAAAVSNQQQQQQQLNYSSVSASSSKQVSMSMEEWVLVDTLYRFNEIHNKMSPMLTPSSTPRSMPCSVSPLEEDKFLLCAVQDHHQHSRSSSSSAEEDLMQDEEFSESPFTPSMARPIKMRVKLGHKRNGSNSSVSSVKTSATSSPQFYPLEQSRTYSPLFLNSSSTQPKSPALLDLEEEEEVEMEHLEVSDGDLEDVEEDYKMASTDEDEDFSMTSPKANKKRRQARAQPEVSSNGQIAEDTYFDEKNQIYVCNRCKVQFKSKARYDKHITYSLDHDKDNFLNWGKCCKCGNRYHPDSLRRHEKSCGQGQSTSSKAKALYKIANQKKESF